MNGVDLGRCGGLGISSKPPEEDLERHFVAEQGLMVLADFLTSFLEVRRAFKA